MCVELKVLKPQAIFACLESKRFKISDVSVNGISTEKDTQRTSANICRVFEFLLVWTQLKVETSVTMRNKNSATIGAF